MIASHEHQARSRITSVDCHGRTCCVSGSVWKLYRWRPACACRSRSNCAWRSCAVVAGLVTGLLARHSIRHGDMSADSATAPAPRAAVRWPRTWAGATWWCACCGRRSTSGHCCPRGPPSRAAAAATPPSASSRSVPVQRHWPAACWCRWPCWRAARPAASCPPCMPAKRLWRHRRRGEPTASTVQG